MSKEKFNFEEHKKKIFEVEKNSLKTIIKTKDSIACINLSGRRSVENLKLVSLE